jgi:hypothetical protein
LRASFFTFAFPDWPVIGHTYFQNSFPHPNSNIPKPFNPVPPANLNPAFCQTSF